VSGETVAIKGPEGSFSGYLARPASGQGAGVVVIQEIFGVNGWVRSVAEGLAAQGFFALAPDLFWRLEPNVQLTDKSEAEWQKAFGLMQKFDIDRGVKDIQATIDTLRKLQGATGKAGAVGFCLGGLLAYLTAARTDADAAVGYYGVSIDERLAEAKNIKKPLMLHIANKDQFVKPEAQEKIVAGLGKNPLVTIHRYTEQDHAFARTGGEHYDKTAAELAGKRSVDFFRKNLA
jgi:carboxymethylenebutenolidase